MSDKKLLVALQAVNAYAGPRTLDATQARFSHVSGGDTGLMAKSDGESFVVLAASKAFYIYELTTPPSTFTEITRFFRDATYGQRQEIAGIVLGGSINVGYAGLFRSGGGTGDYALIIDNSYNTLLNARSSLGIRVNNIDRISVLANNIEYRTDTGHYFKIAGTDKVWVEASQVRARTDFFADGRNYSAYVNGSGAWDAAQFQTSGGGNTLPRISFWCPNVAGQLRGNSTYSDNLEVINNTNGAYAAIRASSFPTASSIVLKKDVRPLRIRELPPVNLDPRADKVTQPDIMALRPVSYRPKVGSIAILPTSDKPVDPADPTSWYNEERPHDTVLGHEGHRERLGLVAEEVEKVIPCAVDHYADGSMGAIDYAQITVALLDHVQRLTDEVSTLRYRIAELEKQ